MRAESVIWITGMRNENQMLADEMKIYMGGVAGFHMRRRCPDLTLSARIPPPSVDLRPVLLAAEKLKRVPAAQNPHHRGDHRPESCMAAVMQITNFAGTK